MLLPANPSLPPFVPSLCSAASSPGMLTSIAEDPSCRQPPPGTAWSLPPPPPLLAAAAARPPEPARWAPVAASPTGLCRTCRTMNTTSGEVAACCARACGPCPCVRRQPLLPLSCTRPCSARLCPPSRRLENFGNTCYCNSVLQTLYFCRPFRCDRAARDGCHAVAPNQGAVSAALA